MIERSPFGSQRAREARGGLEASSRFRQAGPALALRLRPASRSSRAALLACSAATPLPGAGAGAGVTGHKER